MLQPVVFFYRLQSTYNFYVILKQQNSYDKKKKIYIEKMLNSYYIGLFYLKNNNI